jgi:hypothetical protein
MGAASPVSMQNRMPVVSPVSASSYLCLDNGLEQHISIAPPAKEPIRKGWGACASSTQNWPICAVYFTAAQVTFFYNSTSTTAPAGQCARGSHWKNWAPWTFPPSIISSSHSLLCTEAASRQVRGTHTAPKPYAAQRARRAPGKNHALPN